MSLPLNSLASLSGTFYLPLLMLILSPLLTTITIKNIKYIISSIMTMVKTQLTKKSIGSNIMKIKTLIAASLLSLSAMSQVVTAAETAETQKQVEQVESQQVVININSATEEELTKIKGVGNKKSKAIIAYREKIGQFESVEQLTEVEGIGQGILDNNKGMLAVK
ncbi:ComEA family DNA-binding protein [Motilimonas sp. KMU-193]|uniref:ComEA family DNA-binding protein n=1 Tax=Motilimonas sp. KMU-193 TaxID=3388668 RepID=UPI00396B240E